jgi:hypothetical protein
MKPYYVFYVPEIIPQVLDQPKPVAVDVDISRCRTAEHIMRCIENAVKSKLGISETIIIQAVYPLN